MNNKAPTKSTRFTELMMLLWDCQKDWKMKGNGGKENRENRILGPNWPLNPWQTQTIHVWRKIPRIPAERNRGKTKRVEQIFQQLIKVLVHSCQGTGDWLTTQISIKTWKGHTHVQVPGVMAI